VVIALFLLGSDIYPGYLSSNIFILYSSLVSIFLIVSQLLYDSENSAGWNVQQEPRKKEVWGNCKFIRLAMNNVGKQKGRQSY
jgi:hypothetical protein